MKTVINSDQALSDYIAFLCEQYAKYHYLEASLTPAKRTIKQNSSRHLYCQMLADELNDRGLDMRKTLKDDVDIPWSGDLIKEHIWRTIQESKLGIKSTTKLSRNQVSEVYDVINRHMVDRFDVFVPWPCEKRDEST